MKLYARFQAVIPGIIDLNGIVWLLIPRRLAEGLGVDNH